MSSTESTQEPELVTQAVETHEKSPQESFAELRKAKDEAEKQAWQAKKELELMQRQLQMQQPPQQEEDFDFRQLEQEDFPEGKNLVKAFGSINKKMSSYEQKLQEKDIKIQALEFAQSHPDFGKIVTPENIEKYIKSDEDNREDVERSSNPLRKVYKLIKQELDKQVNVETKAKTVSQEQKRLDEKESKPHSGSMGVRSAAVTTAAQVSNSKMSKEQKQALWKETQSFARR